MARTLLPLLVALAACGPGTGGGLPLTANSIAVVAGAGRADPEGVAAASPRTSEVTWKDVRGADRTVWLHAYLYQYDFSFTGGAADPSQVIHRTANDDAYGHEGFGYVVSHNTVNGNSPLGKANPPGLAETQILSGGHHAIHRVELVYDRDREAGGEGVEIPVVIEWFFATGRDHPVWSVTWRTRQAMHSGVSFDTYRMDTRGPYGSLNWDGAATRAAGDAVGGVAWGDFGLRFETSGSPLTLSSPWTYTNPNSVAFVRAWTDSVNAEMGIVQTRAGDREMGYPDRVVGRERGATSAIAYTDKGNCNGFGDARVYAMPCVNGWPYQLMNYDWDPGTGKPVGEATGTKLIAWGTPYGYVGASDLDLFDSSATVDARGDRSYATFIVLGPKCRFAGGVCDQPGDVMSAVADAEALSAAAVSAVSVGSVATEAPRGPGATETKALVGGYDDTPGVFALVAADDAVAFSLIPTAGKPVRAPIFRIAEYGATAVPRITVGGEEVTVNSGVSSSGAFVSLDTATRTLWVTLNRTVDTSTSVLIEAPAAQ